MFGELIKILTPFSEVPAATQSDAPRKAITPKVKAVDLDAAERKLLTPRFGKEPSIAKECLQVRL